MAATTNSATSEQVVTTASPSTSPRRPRRKHQDSFMLFENASTSQNASAEDLSRASLSEASPERNQDSDKEPLFLRLIMMPLLSVSFLLSLFLVERSSRARRSSEHPSQHQAPSDRSFWSTFTVQNWLDPEPYQNPDNATWQGADAGSPQPKQKWYMRKKLRKMGKIQITDALELRNTVLVALLTLSAMVLVGMGWVGSKVYYGLMA